MKEVIERLQTLADRAKKYYWKDESQVVVKLSDVRAVLDFYESRKIESKPPNTQDITPEWDKILDGFYYFVAINADGEEYAYRDEPFFSNTSKTWNSCLSNILTRRKFNMKGIDWTKTLSKRPAK